MLLTPILALAALAQDQDAARPAAVEPWIVVAEASEQARHPTMRVDPIRDVGLCLVASGELVAHWTVVRPDRDTTHVTRSSNGGNTWSTPVVLTSFSGASLIAHEGKLHLLGVNGPDRRGLIAVRTSTDGGNSWSEVTDARHGLVRGFGECLSTSDAIRVQKGRAYKLFARDVQPFLPAGMFWTARTVVFVASAELGADWLDASSWRFSSELLLQDEDSGFDWARACLLQPRPNVLAVHANMRSKEGLEPVGASVERTGEKLIPFKEAASMVLPETSFGATDVVDTVTWTHYVLAGKPLGNAYSGTLELWRSQTMKDWRRQSTLLDGVRPDLVSAACVVDGDDLLVILAFAGRRATNSKEDWESRVVFLRVPKFRERDERTPPLWADPLGK